MAILRDPVYLFWLCFLLHLIADYTMQGILANLKQWSWWLDQFELMRHNNMVSADDWEKYRYDWMAGLICHSAMWSLMTFLPLMFLVDSASFSIIIILNIGAHCEIDHLKANKLKINLITDQTIHLLQIVLTVIAVQFMP